MHNVSPESADTLPAEDDIEWPDTDQEFEARVTQEFPVMS
jgi:hypothetical protein